MLGYGIAGLETTVGVGDALLFVALLALGAVTIYCFWLVIASLAFWIVDVWQIMELFDGVYQTGRWPVSIYPGWLRFGVTFLVPIAFAITVPAEAVTSRLDWPTVVLAVGFTAALFVFTRWWWGFGQRRYTGAPPRNSFPGQFRTSRPLHSPASTRPLDRVSGLRSSDESRLYKRALLGCSPNAPGDEPQ